MSSSSSSPPPHWEVHKFGGTSVASASCYCTAAQIIEDMLAAQPDLRLAVVVSAMGGKPKTTDLLLQSVQAAAERNETPLEAALDKICQKHFTCLQELFREQPEEEERLTKIIRQDLHDIRDILKTVALMRWQASRIRELVSGYGELWSAQILTALLQHRAAAAANTAAAPQPGGPHFAFLDARRVITIDEDAIQDGAVCWDISQQKLEQVTAQTLSELPPSASHKTLHWVITGYVASNTRGVATTLQRDGSDYSAAIMAKLLQSTYQRDPSQPICHNISIWTDVDGVLSADPRRVPSAQILSEVSYNEAMELAYFGAKVIHPKTMQPAISAHPQIPIYIRNTFHASYRGTRIYTSSTTHTDRDKCVCGFSSVEDMALINVEGSGLIGVPGVAKRMFGALEAAGVNVVLISQASSEHSITFCAVKGQAGTAKTAIEEEFHKELKNNRISQVDVQSPCSIIAAVGDGMSATAGVAGRFFSALGDAKINVLAISQGCSERNISAVVMTDESTRALRAVHAAFRLSHTVVRVAVIGMQGDIGKSLVKLLAGQRNKIRESYEVDLQVVVVANDGTVKELVTLQQQVGSSDSITISAYTMATGGTGDASGGVDFDNTTDVAQLTEGGVSDLTKYLISDECAHHIIFDCTDQDEVSQFHAGWLRDGIHVVTANPSGLAGSRERRDEIAKAASMHGKLSANYLGGVTVGGALPCIDILKSLINSGDRIKRMDGILSVSMSYIMYRISPPIFATECMEFDEVSSKGFFKGGELPASQLGERAVCLSEAVKEAVALGLMEEDPGKDLNNNYCAQVMLVLAKELGLDHSKITTTQIAEMSDNLIQGNKTVDYKNISKDIDDEIQQRVDAAKSKGCVLRHIASVDVKTQSIDIRIVEVPSSHVFAATPPSCECVRFFTERHRRFPLIIQGPSAGADSTASALLAEVLSLMRSKVGPKSGGLSRTASSRDILNQQQSATTTTVTAAK